MTAVTTWSWPWRWAAVPKGARWWTMWRALMESPDAASPPLLSREIGRHVCHPRLVVPQIRLIPAPHPKPAAPRSQRPRHAVHLHRRHLAERAVLPEIPALRPAVPHPVRVT